jgi:3-phosphoshikimate 1-carboxyvinyltransferase
VAADDEDAWRSWPAGLDLRFGHGPEGSRTWLRGREVSEDLRSRSGGPAGLARLRPAPVREALLGLQLAFRRAPGLVADGRDMGTVVFPDATLKVFLTASPAQRASGGISS